MNADTINIHLESEDLDGMSEPAFPCIIINRQRNGDRTESRGENQR